MFKTKSVAGIVYYQQTCFNFVVLTEVFIFSCDSGYGKFLLFIFVF